MWLLQLTGCWASSLCENKQFHTNKQGTTLLKRQSCNKIRLESLMKRKWCLHPWEDFNELNKVSATEMGKWKFVLVCVNSHTCAASFHLSIIFLLHSQHTARTDVKSTVVTETNTLLNTEAFTSSCCRATKPSPVTLQLCGIWNLLAKHWNTKEHDIYKNTSDTYFE